MKPFLYYTILMASLLLPLRSGGDDVSAGGVTYVIPVKDMIERALTHVIRRGVNEAEAAGAEVIILDMDTPGGRLDATQEIIDLLAGSRATTYTLVNPNAISAGAIIAFATDHIYMTPGGRIGDAMPIMMSPLPFGGAQPVPDDLKEKMVSPTVALVRSAAQRKGHDPKLAEAMVRAEMEYKIGDKMICPAGQLLTLTSEDASQWVGEGEQRRRLLARGTVANLEELLKTIGRGGDRVVVVEATATERMGRIIEGFPVSGILLGLGLLCIYIEFKTPGFGIPGISGMILLALWFWGHHVAGLAGSTEVIVFVIGVALLLIEILLIPGFGITGIAGLALMVSAVLMAMVEYSPASPGFTPPQVDIYRAVYNLGLALLLTFLAGAVLARFLPRTHVFQHIALGAVLAHEEGYGRESQTISGLVGAEGVAATALRPAGIGQVGGERLNVVARGSFIEKGAPIVVAEVHGNRIVVDHPRTAASGEETV